MKPFCWLDCEGKAYTAPDVGYAEQKGWKPLFTAAQLAEEYQRGKREGLTAVLIEISDRYKKGGDKIDGDEIYETVDAMLAAAEGEENAK